MPNMPFDQFAKRNHIYSNFMVCDDCGGEARLIEIDRGVRTLRQHCLKEMKVSVWRLTPLMFTNPNHRKLMLETKMIKLSEMAKLANCSEIYLRSLVRKRKIPFFRPEGTRIMFASNAVEQIRAYIEIHKHIWKKKRSGGKPFHKKGDTLINEKQTREDTKKEVVAGSTKQIKK